MTYEGLAIMIKRDAKADVMLDEPMSAHTSLKIGGRADIFVTPKGEESLRKVIEIAKSENIRYFVIGNGTNLLVSDEGVRGMVIQMKEGFSRLIVKKTKKFALVKAEAGVLLSKVLSLAKSEGFAGFEFAAGIPGSVGGALVMNASTRLGAISDVVSSIEVIDKKGKAMNIKREDLDFGYRKLNIDNTVAILGGVFCLNYGDKEEINEKISGFLKERRKSQPKGESAGCIFKNPLGESAGRIIEELGFKGQKMGGAYVSDVHANFIMNDGTATCKNFISLIRKIRQRVFEEKDIKLEYEIKFLGNM